MFARSGRQLVHRVLDEIRGLVFRSSGSRAMAGGLLQLSDLSQMPRRRLTEAVRARSRSAYLGDDIVLCRILGRYKFFVDTRDVGFASHLMLDGFWEMWLTQFVARQVKPGMQVIDIGANFGYYSLLMSDLVSAKGRCVCIEANPAVARRLEASLSINGFGSRSTVEICAAGDGAQATVRFYVPHQEPKNARVVAFAERVDLDQGHVIEVPCKAVDELCAGLDRLDFVKIDAEGAEPQILRGMRGLLTRFRPDMILEFNYQRYQDPQAFIADIAANYPALRYLDIDGLIKPVTASQLAQEHPGEDWLLFLSNR